MRWVTFSALLLLAQERNISVTGLIDQILVDELERVGMAGGLLTITHQRWADSKSRAIRRRRRSTSIRGEVYTRLDALAQRRGLLLTSLLDDLARAELARAGRVIEPVRTPARAYKREGRPPREAKPVAERPVDDRWFGGYAEFGGSGSVAPAKLVEPRVIPRELR